MIKNIICDVNGFLCTYSAHAFRVSTQGNEEVECMFDAMTCDKKYLKTSANASIPESYAMTYLMQANNIPDRNFGALASACLLRQNINVRELIEYLHSRDIKFYVVGNLSMRDVIASMSVLDFLQNADGYTLSCAEHIYGAETLVHRLMSNYKLAKAETIAISGDQNFISDFAADDRNPMPVNAAYQSVFTDEEHKIFDGEHYEDVGITTLNFIDALEHLIGE